MLTRNQQKLLRLHGPTARRSPGILKLASCSFSHDKIDQHLVDVEYVRRWSMKNEDLARDVLNVPQPPPPFSKYDFEASKGSNFMDYLVWRRWNPIFSDGGEDKDALKMSYTLLSHALTFPLTLGDYVNGFLLQKPQMDSITFQCGEGNKEPKSRVFRLCCVGPRAEATLPLDMWREFLILANLQTWRNKIENDRVQDLTSMESCVNLDWIIDFIGPDVPSQMKSRAVHLETTDSGSDDKLFHRSLTMNYHCGYLHQYILEMYQKRKKDHFDKHDVSSITSNLLKYWDGFVLFNPGIGHKNLMKSWSPTLEFILNTEKKILTTAHSVLDSQRDLQLWKQMILTHHKGGETVDIQTLEYEQNEYASRMSYHDPFPQNAGEIHLVNPNHSILMIQHANVGQSLC